jgi:transcriptional regulator with XRE-family HTH domain
MLLLARQRRGFQQTEAANRLKITQSQLSRTENGLLEITDELLRSAVRVYDFPITFFEQQDPIYGAPVSVHPMWRRKADVSARDMDAVVAELNLRVMHLRRFWDGIEVANTSDMPRLDIEEYHDPERIAGIVRAHWKVPAGPVQDLTVLVEKAGAIVNPGWGFH